MPNKLVAALKENKNNVRRKALVVGGIVVTAVAAGVILHRINANTVDLLIVPAESIAAATEAVVPQ